MPATDSLLTPYQFIVSRWINSSWQRSAFRDSALCASRASEVDIHWSKQQPFKFNTIKVPRFRKVDVNLSWTRSQWSPLLEHVRTLLNRTSTCFNHISAALNHPSHNKIILTPNCPSAKWSKIKVIKKRNITARTSVKKTQVINQRIIFMMSKRSKSETTQIKKQPNVKNDTK